MHSAASIRHCRRLAGLSASCLRSATRGVLHIQQHEVDFPKQPRDKNIEWLDVPASDSFALGDLHRMENHGPKEDIVIEVQLGLHLLERFEDRYSRP